MITIVNYFRRVFCKHELEYEDGCVNDENNDIHGYKRYIYCKKCGYHSSHWKFI